MLISIICVFNDKNILEENLINSLEYQNEEYELILLDNRTNKFSSAAEALNFGANQAKGDLFIFSHQDIKFYKSVCKFFSKKNDAKRNAYKTEKKLVEKKNTDEQKVKKSARYRNYKKIYKNNLKFIEDDRIYEKPYRNHLSFKNVANK